MMWYNEKVMNDQTANPLDVFHCSSHMSTYFSLQSTGGYFGTSLFFQFVAVQSADCSETNLDTHLRRDSEAPLLLEEIVYVTYVYIIIT